MTDGNGDLPNGWVTTTLCEVRLGLSKSGLLPENWSGHNASLVDPSAYVPSAINSLGDRFPSALWGLSPL